MKVLCVTSRFPFGPKESFLTEEIAQLANAFDVLVVPALPTAQPIAVEPLRERALRLRLLSPRVLRLALAELIRSRRRAAHAFCTIVSAPRAMHAKIKNVVIFPTALAVANIARRERIDHVHAYWLTAPSTIAYVVSQLCGVPWSATGHRYDLVDFNVRTGDDPNASFFPSAAFVRTISQQGAQRLATAFRNNVPPMRVIHLGVGVPPPRARTLEPGVLRLLCAANLERVKGHEVLLRALARASRHADVRCTIAGDGTLREQLERQSIELGLRERVIFEGVVPHERLLERMASDEFDAAILTSIDEGPAEREGIPVVLMEAMARGLPVIATRSGAVAELADEEHAFLCAPGDTNAISSAIVALANDVMLRARLAEAGRARVESAFDVRSCAGALATLIVDEPRTRSLTLKGIEIPA